MLALLSSWSGIVAEKGAVLSQIEATSAVVSIIQRQRRNKCLHLELVDFRSYVLTLLELAGANGDTAALRRGSGANASGSARYGSRSEKGKRPSRVGGGSLVVGADEAESLRQSFAGDFLRNESRGAIALKTDKKCAVPSRLSPPPDF